MGVADGGLVLATHNQHKLREFRQMLGADIAEYDGPEPAETGASFVENALIKARAAAAHTGLPAMADDSGLCVDVMGGAPGIFSARWAGARAGDAANVELLLAQLADIPAEHRGAHFSCTIALVTPGGVERVVEGVWPGAIAAERAGASGFGYDPIFVPEGLDVTAAELAPERKNELSHRARAFARMREVLADIRL